MGNRSVLKRIKIDQHYTVLDMVAGTTTTANSPIVLSWSNTRTGADNPLWRSNVMRGENATNALTATKYDVAYTLGNIITSYLPTAYHYKGEGIRLTSEVLCTPSFPALGIDTTLKANALNSAAIGIRKRIHDQGTKISGLTFLGELRESIHMIRHPATALSQFLHGKLFPLWSAKNRIPKVAFSRMLSDTWLEVCFGALPLMSDIGAIAEASLARCNEERIKRLAFTSQASKSSSSSGNISVTGGTAARMLYVQEDTDEVSCRFTVGYRVEVSGCDNPLRNVISLSGFNLSEVIPAAWELLPWSFFIDYFSNIGDVISSSLVSTEDVAWSSLTTRRVAKRDQSVLSSKAWSESPTAVRVHGGSDFYSSTTLTQLERARAGIPFGTLRFDVPGRTGQYFNILALARTVQRN